MSLSSTPILNPVRQCQVDTEHAGRRIDNYLTSLLKDLPKSRIYRMLRTGEVRVNGGRVAPDYRLNSGDLLRIPPLREAPASAVATPPAGLMRQLEGAVLYEDNGLLVLNKPSGIPAHGGTGFRFGVIETLRVLWKKEKYLELVHRLDRETSGCLLIAKQPTVLRQLHDLLRDGGIDKTYQALVKGYWPEDLTQIRLAIRKDSKHTGDHRVEVSTEGKEAITETRPLQHFRSTSLLEARIMTGRMHQIRVHVAHAGHPLAGDDKYGDWEFNKELRAYGLKRLFLHAWRITLPQAGGKKRLTLEAELPADLQQVLEQLP